MGMHQFMKNAGAVALKAKENRAEEARKYIARILGKDVDDIEGLKVELEDDRIRLSGKCKSQSTLEKAILLAGNITGISAVMSDGLKLVGKGVAGVARSRFYTIKAGDTLSKVAKEFYGDAKRYTEIVEANKGVIENADRIYPGQVIRIP
jgi:nucleoid-associated protein YgaU